MVNRENYYQQVDSYHRKNLGQFFTHPTVAHFMVDWVLQSGENNIYDPAFGLGAFYDPVEKQTNIHFYGSEIDTTIFDFWLSHHNQSKVSVTVEDYLLSWKKCHKNIVCNPPYMRFQKFLNRDKVATVFEKELGIKLSGYTNTASAFLLKSLSEMDGTGRLAYIMPLEFLNTGYGSLIKEKMIVSEHLVAIIKLDCEKEIFPDATTSVGIILYDSNKKYSSVSFYNISSIQSLCNFPEISSSRIVPLFDLDPKLKWLPYFQSDKIKIASSNLVSLSYYGRFSRGIATGANEFFILKPSEVRSKKILVNECLPCISKSPQIRKAIFDDYDYEQLLKLDSSVLLFSVNENHSDAAEKYIQDGIKKGFNERFLTKNRTPWYKTEKREPSPLLLGVFSRGNYKIILNKSNATNLTCFHGFQANLFGIEQVERLFLYLSSQAGRRIISLSLRKYGDGLDKFEPNDINKALVPTSDYLNCLSKEIVEEALNFIKKVGTVPDSIEQYFDPLIERSPSI